MRVTSVEMYSATLEESITFSLENSGETSQYMVRTILGLDADEIIQKFYSRGIVSGDKYYDFGLKKRDIVLSVILTPRFILDETYADVRDELYRTIYANRSGLITLHFKSGGSLVAKIEGSIIKFETDHFTKLPEVKITIRCNNPMFQAINPVIFEASELSETNPLIVPDSISTAPHGFVFHLTVATATPSISIQDAPTTPDWKFKVMPAGGFLAGDIIFLSSNYSDKYFRVFRSPNWISLANAIEPSSVWPIIFPGANTFYIDDITKFNTDYLEYYPSYWGV